MNYVNIIFESLEKQKKFHQKNISMLNNIFDRNDYLDMLKEDYIYSLFIRNKTIINEYKRNHTSSLLLETVTDHRTDINIFFDFLKKSSMIEAGLADTRIFKSRLNEQWYKDAYNYAAGKVKSAYNKGKQVAKQVYNKGKQVVTKVAAAVSPYIKKVLDSQFAYFIPGLNVIKLGADAKKVYDNWDKIKKFTLDDWVNVFRNFLNGSVGIAIQIVLALTGVGNAANLIAWGLLLGYDLIYMGFIKGNWNWYNILTDCVGLLGTGAAAVAFKAVKPILAAVKGAKAIGPAIAKGAPNLLSKITPLIQKIGSGAASLLKSLGQGITWLIQKIPLIGRLLTPIKNSLGKAKGFIDDLVHGFQKHFKGNVTQNMKVTKGAHFDTTHIAKKLTALGDKTLTKKVIGGVTKVFYTLAAGDTLNKIIGKYKLPDVNYLKNLNSKEHIDVAKIVPGKQIRVA
jgi:hypothetical protein